MVGQVRVECALVFNAPLRRHDGKVPVGPNGKRQHPERIPSPFEKASVLLFLCFLTRILQEAHDRFLD